jgi:hypothetical protein
MEAYVFGFTAKDLRKIEARSLGFLVSSEHCANELTALMPYIAFEQSLEDKNDVETALILTRRYTINRIIVSKIVEYDELCSKFVKAVSADDKSFASNLKQSLETIRGEFKPPTWALIMRNKASFHYDQKFAAEGMVELHDDHSLRLIAGRIGGLTLFEFSEEVFSRSVFQKAGGGDVGAGMTVVTDFILRAIKVIRAFQAKSMISAFKHFKLVSSRDRIDLREEFCADPSIVKIPLSISEEGVRNFKSSGQT